MPEIVCIFGATSSGKSSLAIAVAKHFGGEIISADSMQVYRGFDIGTGKVVPEEQEGVPHHLLDCRDPGETFSAGEFQQQAGGLIREMRSRGILPIIAGGTGLYFRALLHGLAPVGPPDRKLRKRLREKADEKGIAALHRILRRLDPETAEKLPVNDTQRILRALEYRLSTGTRLSETIARQPFAHERYDAVKIGLRCERSTLRSRIDDRVDAMFAAGWIEEVEALLASGVPQSSQAFRAIGYREILRYLKKEVTLEEAKELIKTATHQYAKRQETWFRKEQRVHWLDKTNLRSLTEKSIRIIGGYKNGRRRNKKKNGT
jgi:tRNA dimethylallyltransferase